MTYYGLHALQHRGQEATGIVTSDFDFTRRRPRFLTHKGVGLVADVFKDANILKDQLRGRSAIGHNRYSTTGASENKLNIQPFVVNYRGGNLALSHNGNLTNFKTLRERLEGEGTIFQSTSDSEIILHLTARSRKENQIQQIKEALETVEGAYSLVILTDTSLIAARDPHGFRPLALGRLGDAFVVASETCAFAPIGADFEREILPGEMLVISAKGGSASGGDEAEIRSEQIAPSNPKLDIFEFVYFARPDSELLGKSVDAVRKNYGIQLAKEHSLKADVVIPVPDTAIPSAIGFARASGIPFEIGIIKNRYIHRTFITPDQHVRERGVKAKLTPLPYIIAGKRVIIVDDSIVRGTNSRQIVKMVFDAGASEVHFLVASPPVKYPDFYGIDTPQQEKLLAATKSLEEMRKFLGATSLHFLSYEGLIQATEIPENQLCTSCFTGVYPIDIGERAKEVRKVDF